jgi:hypothetical protein
MPVLPRPIEHVRILVQVINGIDSRVGAKVQFMSIVHFDSPKSFVVFPSSLSFPNIHTTLIEGIDRGNIA